MSGVDFEELSRLFFNATGFKNTFYFLIKHISGYDSDANLFPVAVVNGSLSIELFLKFLLYHDKYISKEQITIIRSHKLNDLYNQLSEDKKKKITKLIKDFLLNENELNNFLNTHNNDFIEYRYTESYSNYATDFAIMVKLIESLYNISHSILNSLCITQLNLPRFEAEIDNDMEEIIDCIDEKFGIKDF